MTFIPKINLINLGADAAEDDKDLIRYFFETPSYDAISHGEKYILVGNRGVGKTAIFKSLAQHQKKNGHTVIELSPEEYSYDVLSSILKKESDGSWGKQSSFSISWQYLIYCLVFKEIVSRKKGLVSGARKLIYQYVRDNLKDPSIPHIGIMISYLKRLEGIKLGKYEGNFKRKDLHQLYELQEIKELLPSLCQILETSKIYIYVDELDKGWDNSEDARYFVAGLIQAVQKINNLHENLKVFVSIRQELFDNIPQVYEDAQKIRGRIETIRWNEESLLDFISLRLKRPFPELEKLKPKEIWNSFFTETLEYRKTNSYNYIVDRTQLRPREFLQLSRECINQIKRDFCLINYDMISHAVQIFSENKIKDLESEYRFQYPGLLEVFNTFRGGKYNIEKEDLDNHLFDICQKNQINKADWLQNLDNYELKRILWMVGFLKAWVVGGLKAGRKSGSAYVGHYELSTVNIDSIARFQIHPAFWAYLVLKEK